MYETMENYLKILFNLEQTQTKAIKPTALVKRLNVSAAAVSEILKKLGEAGYLSYVPYKGIRLTPKGIQEGQAVVRRHRIWEMYLHKIVGLPIEKVHAEAEQLEHASSDALIDKLEEILGFPTVDPHGDPIPTREGQLPKLKPVKPLSSCEAGSKVIVSRVSDFDEEFLRYLGRIGIELGKHICIKEIHRFDNSFVIEIDNKSVSISHFSAEHIYVSQE